MQLLSSCRSVLLCLCPLSRQKLIDNKIGLHHDEARLAYGLWVSPLIVAVVCYLVCVTMVLYVSTDINHPGAHLKQTDMLCPVDQCMQVFHFKMST